MRALAIQASLCCSIWIAGSDASAQSAAETEPEREREVLATVEHVLELLGGLRFYALEPYFTNDANIVTSRKTKQQFVNRVVSARTWIQNMSAGLPPQPFEEVLSNVEVTIEAGELAFVRADFEIVRNGKVESSGVDFFTLIRRQGVWKISSIAHTSIPAVLESQ